MKSENSTNPVLAGLLKDLAQAEWLEATAGHGVLELFFFMAGP